MRRGSERLVACAVAGLALLAVTGFAAGGTGATPGESAARPSTKTRIVYQGFDTVWSVRPNGTGRHLLAKVDLDPTQHIINVRDLAASRNGKRIFVVTESINSGPGGGLNHRIIRFNGRGKQRKPLFNPSFTHGTTSISVTADGKKIAFPTSSGLYVANFDGSGKHLLTGVRVKHPSISGDGQRVVFERNTSGNQDIWAMDTSGGSMTRLTNDPGDETWPVYSPNRTTIAYGSDRNGGVLRMMSARGKGDHVIATSKAGEETRPDFSPGGNSLVYVARLGGYRFFTVRLDGTHRRSVTGIHGKGPAWTRLP